MLEAAHLLLVKELKEVLQDFELLQLLPLMVVVGEEDIQSLVLLLVEMADLVEEEADMVTLIMVLLQQVQEIHLHLAQLKELLVEQVVLLVVL